tara:strand:+ start:3344 stop:4114 length:771 start_codon:yes stop_codon:yes gene_type:complete
MHLFKLLSVLIVFLFKKLSTPFVIIFGNSSGFHTNLVALLRLISTPPKDLELYDCTEFIQKDHIEPIHSFLSSRIFDSSILFHGTVPIYPFKYASHLQDYIKIEGKGADSLVKQLIHFDELNKPWLDLGLKLEVLRFSASKNSPKSLVHSCYSDDWHFDMVDLNIIMCFINLSDVTPHSGPFCFTSRKITKRYISKLHINRKLPSSSIHPSHYNTLIGPPGTAVMIHNSTHLHRASFVQEGTREMAIIWFRIVRNN